MLLGWEVDINMCAVVSSREPSLSLVTAVGRMLPDHASNARLDRTQQVSMLEPLESSLLTQAS